MGELEEKQPSLSGNRANEGSEGDTEGLFIVGGDFNRPQVPVFSRRWFITRGLPLGLGATAAAGIVVRQLLQPAPKDSQRETATGLLFDIENNYRVQIGWRNGYSWSLDTLELLKNTLNGLPAKIAARKSKGEGILLDQTTIIYGGEDYDVVPTTDGLPGEVNLSKQSFSKENSLSASNLTYRLVAERLGYVPLAGQVEAKTYGEQLEYWSDQLSRTINYTDLQALLPDNPNKTILRIDLLEKALRTGGIPSEDRETWQALEKGMNTNKTYVSNTDVRPGYYAVFTGNLIIPALAAHFVRGKDYFMKMYGEFFGEIVAVKLYTFMKSNLFGGKEYPNPHVMQAENHRAPGH